MKKILLLHADDKVPRPTRITAWDMVVDFGRAPRDTYESWKRECGAEVFSLHQFGREIDDLRRLRELLQLGIGSMVDRTGLDWWDLLCLFVASDLQQLMLIHRLSKELSTGCELYSSRPHPLASALAQLRGARLTILESGFRSAIRRIRHSHDAFSRLDTAQLVQMWEDKFYAGTFSRRRPAPGADTPVIVLPSAYINVSRTALSYAEVCPDHQFLLVASRRSGRIHHLPPNVQLASLSSYFLPGDKDEIASLLKSWGILRKHLAHQAEEFGLGDAVGMLGKIPALLPWGVTIRDAWNQLFESENVTACLSADDSNPPSSIPLLMAQRRGLPALACHHGALDYQMAIKQNHADFYLVKSEMEQDYLQRSCNLAPERIVIAPPPSSKPVRLQATAPWLVFFTEPYESYAWRRDEVYRELLPRLCSLAQTCGLKLVFKLHPFESVKGHRAMLRRLIPEQEREIDLIAGPPSDRLWNNTKFALTVQSSTALECAALGISVFLCGWLRDSYSGYVQQYARFGAGRVLDSPEQINEIPWLLEHWNGGCVQRRASCQGVDSDKLADLFSGAYTSPMANTA